MKSFFAKPVGLETKRELQRDLKLARTERQIEFARQFERLKTGELHTELLFTAYFYLASTVRLLSAQRMDPGRVWRLGF